MSGVMPRRATCSLMARRDGSLEEAFRAAGLRQVRWHAPEVSPEGLREFGQGYWADFLARPAVGGRRRAHVASSGLAERIRRATFLRSTTTTSETPCPSKAGLATHPTGGVNSSNTGRRAGGSQPARPGRPGRGRGAEQAGWPLRPAAAIYRTPGAASLPRLILDTRRPAESNLYAIR
jgi:hypothetical protein